MKSKIMIYVGALVIVMSPSNVFAFSDPLSGSGRELSAVNVTAAGFSDDAQVDVWAKEAIEKVKQLNLMVGYENGDFRPLTNVTRQEAAKVLAGILNLSVAPVKTSSFSDVSVTGWSHPYIEAVKEAGILHGDPDGKFRPNDPITREELAIILVNAVNADIEGKRETLTVADKDVISEWAKDYVGASMDLGLLKGDGTKFNPKNTATREEFAVTIQNLLDYAAKPPVTDLPVINEVADDKVTIDGIEYQVPDNLKGLFNSANEPVLKNARIRMEAADSSINKVTYLEIVNNGQPEGKDNAEFSKDMVLEGNAASIEGDVKVSADYITVKNLVVDGKFEISPLLLHDFYGYHVKVSGDILINGGSPDTVVFEDGDLQHLSVNQSGVHVELRGKSSLSDMTLTADAHIEADPDVSIPQATIADGANHVQLDADVDLLTVSNKNSVDISGTSDIRSLKLNEGSSVSLNTEGTISNLQIVDPKTKLTLSDQTKVAVIHLPNGANVEDLISNYDQVKGQINQVVYDPLVSSGGGSTPIDTQAPIVQNVRSANVSTATADVYLTSNEIGTGYYVVLPESAQAPSVTQIRNGKDNTNSPALSSGSQSLDANAEAVFHLAGLTASTGYKVFVVAADRSGNLSSVESVDVHTIANISAPTIESISPTSGTVAGGTTVTLTGTDFTDATAVTFGGMPAASFQVDSATQITAVAPAGTAGAVDIVVTTPGGSATETGGFTYVAAPTITQLNPTSGSDAGGTSVTITGTGLGSATSVTFDGTPAASFQVDSATQITAVAPAGTAGAVDVVVTTPGGSAMAAEGFTYFASPTITSLSPTTGSNAGGTSVTITGTDFTGATAVTFGGTPAASFQVDSATQITAVAPAGSAGPVDVVVTTPGGSATAAGGFTYFASPTITQLSPTTGSNAGGTSVTITGTDFTGATAVTFGGTPADAFQVDSATQITAVAPAGSAGPVDVVVTTAGGSAMAAGGFTYFASPTITSLSPSSGSNAGGTSVTVTGTDFTGATAVTFGGTPADAFQVDSATQI
ncbi:IPT/TIG domain-containing protein, partial [Cohnella zeiphila]